MTNWEKLISDDELKETAKSRKTIFVQKRVAKELIQGEINAGWLVAKNYADESALLQKEKPVGDSFEDEVWALFYDMGFQIMNRDRDFHIDYANGLSKQIDVVAIDDEVCLLIECKATAQEDNTKTWKTDLEAINGFREKLFGEIRTKYPGRKCKYIFATKNYVIGTKDTERMNEFQIANFDYETVRYYAQLVTHLGKSAKYQLLGSIFAHQTINQMDDRVPAIEGKMGGLTYYSFVIEPERLLKVAYVLHRNKANHRMMPTYQRLIKKDRLTAIRKYVNAGGYFPNSLIVSVDTDNRGIRFEPSQARIGGSTSRLGILRLPKKYQSIYVIDGQHRLYGYSESEWATNNSIPVVAFIDLPKQKQVSMFMDINQNQKPVSKALRNTLNIDLLWESESLAERQEALMLDIGQRLGEDVESPLHGRVVTGEDSVQGKRCITLEYIKEALKNSRFFNTYKKKKNEIQVLGTFSKNSNDETLEHFYPFLTKCLSTIKAFCLDEWNKGQDGYLTINNTMYAVIKIIDDITNIVLAKQGKTVVDDPNTFFSACEEWVVGLCDTLINLDPETADGIKKEKGGGAKKKSWRMLQVAFHSRCSDFINDDLQKYIDENCVDYNSESFVMLQSLFSYFKNKAWRMMPDKDNWLNQYLPRNIQEDLIGKTAIENSRRTRDGGEANATEWELLTIRELSELIKFGTNWSIFAQDIFAWNGGNATKTEALLLLKNFASYEDKLNRDNDITFPQHEEIKGAYDKYVRPTLGVATIGEDNSDGTNS